MKERPIIFSGPMVRAILDGRKTQTRRVVKNPGLPCATDDQHRDEFMRNGRCPYGYPGDRLWVRETCRAFERREDAIDGVVYSADGAFRPIENTNKAADQWCDLYAYGKQRGRIVPSIHMPRWASRITLEVSGVRVERLQKITEADAVAEGLKSVAKDGKLFKWGIPDSDGCPGNDQPGSWHWHEWEKSPIAAFRKLWASINGSDSWDANPWVWVIEFKRSDAEDGL